MKGIVLGPGVTEPAFIPVTVPVSKQLLLCITSR